MGGNRNPHSSIPSTSGKECQGLAMSFRDSAGDSKYRGHFSSTALCLLLPKVHQSPLPPLGLSLWMLAPGRQPLAIASADPGREQAWVGVSGSQFSGRHLRFRFAHLVDALQCLGWQRGELTLSLHP